MSAWWLPDDYLMTVWWLPDDNLMNSNSPLKTIPFICSLWIVPQYFTATSGTVARWLIVTDCCVHRSDVSWSIQFKIFTFSSTASIFPPMKTQWVRQVCNITYRLYVSMTSLLTHTVAHSTRHSFRPKTNNQPLKKFLKLSGLKIEVFQKCQ